MYYSAGTVLYFFWNGFSAPTTATNSPDAQWTIATRATQWEIASRPTTWELAAK